jgi:hypothetical protein
LRQTLIFLILALGFGLSVKGQRSMDTLDTPYGRIVLYTNKTWAFLKTNVFDGVLNERVHKIMSQEQDVPFLWPWSNEVCFTSRNDLSRLKDTIQLPLVDEKFGGFAMPCPGIVTSRYGPRKGRNHNGIDINLNTGDTVYAAFSGKIRYAKYNEGGFGNLVIIRHHNGLETLYAHLSKFLVFPDQEVKEGEPIGLGGNTGRSYGAHLHFEVRFYDSPMNPEELIDFEGKTLKIENLAVHRGLFRPGAKPSDYFESHPEEEHEKEARPVVPIQQTKYYRVRSGDTLTEIADRHKTTVSKICQLNGIKPTTVLQVGRNLRVK